MCWETLGASSTYGRLSFLFALLDLLIMSLCLLVSTARMRLIAQLPCSHVVSALLSFLAAQVNGLKVHNFFDFKGYDTNIFDLNVVREG